MCRMDEEPGGIFVGFSLGFCWFFMGFLVFVWFLCYNKKCLQYEIETIFYYFLLSVGRDLYGFCRVVIGLCKCRRGLGLVQRWGRWFEDQGEWRRGLLW